MQNDETLLLLITGIRRTDDGDNDDDDVLGMTPIATEGKTQVQFRILLLLQQRHQLPLLMAMFHQDCTQLCACNCFYSLSRLVWSTLSSSWATFDVLIDGNR